jgi:quinohemoprotein ethanol dehydrogenase
LLKADPYTYINWTDGIDLKTGRPHLTMHADYSEHPQIIWPSEAGAHGWQPISYDRMTGLTYIAVYDAPMRMHAPGDAKFEPGFRNQATGGEFPPYTDAADLRELAGQPAPRVESHLKAWDPVQGRTVWSSPTLPFSSGGTLSTAGSLVIQGASDGVLTAYDARSGRVLQRIDTGTAILAAPISYELDGVQYLAVMAGAGGPQAALFPPDVAANRYQNFERLLVFRLEGTPTPLPAPVSPAAQQPTPILIAADAATLAHGAALFNDHCQRCHVVGGGFAAFPNLWNLPPTTLDAFDQIVLGGALRYAGMASFADVLSASDVADIKAFIVGDERARRAAAPAQP